MFDVTNWTNWTPIIYYFVQWSTKIDPIQRFGIESNVQKENTQPFALEVWNEKNRRNALNIQRIMFKTMIWHNQMEIVWTNHYKVIKLANRPDPSKRNGPAGTNLNFMWNCPNLKFICGTGRRVGPFRKTRWKDGIKKIKNFLLQKSFVIWDLEWH